MKSLVGILMVLASLAASQGPSCAQDALRPGELSPYPWIEASDTARIPKGLLPHLQFDAQEYASGPGVPWSSVSAIFVQIYHLRDEETKALNNALRKLQRDRRFEEGRHMQPLEGETKFGTYRSPEGLLVLAQRSFQLSPYSDDLVPIDEAFNAEIVRALGKERAERFRGHSPSRLPPGAKVIEETTTITFRLIEFEGKRSVDRVKVYPQGRGHDGGPFFEEEDEFAPESLRPLLRQWRANAVEFSRTTGVGVGKANVAGSLADGRASVDAKPSLDQRIDAGWDEKVPYVDIPKSLIPRLGLTGSHEGGISPEVVLLFGLSTDDVNAVMALFNQLKIRFEALEATQLERSNAGAGRFILHRFADLAQPLRTEWTAKLETLVGKSRAKLLDSCMRSMPPESLTRMLLLGRGPDPMLRMSGWPVWLNRGEKEVSFDVRLGQGPDERFSLEFKILEGEGAGRGSVGGPMTAFPEAFKHLFHPEVF